MWLPQRRRSETRLQGRRSCAGEELTEAGGFFIILKAEGEAKVACIQVNGCRSEGDRVRAVPQDECAAASGLNLTMKSIAMLQASRGGRYSKLRIG